ncbi:hypothetical protein AMECASPLE_037653 [Ameca splendens]|uniref:Uncharacterized protein n=1 Tax=Ameca splendens TaxID=208324 RepID=A0ABV1AGL1_9TELE
MTQLKHSLTGDSGETARERISVRKEALLARFSPIPGNSQYHNRGLGQVRKKSHLEQVTREVKFHTEKILQKSFTAILAKFSELARRLPRRQNTQATKCWQPSSLCFSPDE